MSNIDNGPGEGGTKLPEIRNPSQQDSRGVTGIRNGADAQVANGNTARGGSMRSQSSRKSVPMQSL